METEISDLSMDDKIIEAITNIKIALRVRPAIEREKTKESTSFITFDTQKNQVHIMRLSLKYLSFMPKRNTSI